MRSEAEEQLSHLGGAEEGWVLTWLLAVASALFGHDGRGGWVCGEYYSRCVGWTRACHGVEVADMRYCNPLIG